MVDTRIAARLVDPAALRSGPIASELSSDEVASALRPHLDPTVMAPELSLLFPPPSGSKTLDAPGDVVDSDGGQSIPALRDDVPHAAPAVPARAAAALEAAGILLPAESLVSTTRAQTSAVDSPPIGALEAMASRHSPAGPDIASGWALPAPTSAEPPGSVLAPEGAWSQGPSLIEPSALLPMPEPRSGGTRIDQGSVVAIGSGPDATSLDEPGWASPASSSPPRARPGRQADASAAFPDASGSRGATDGDALGEVASRLSRAVERLEAAAEHLARQADRSSSPVPRPFRGRAAD